MSEFSGIIWSKLNASIRNDYGTAGLMGNLQAESGLVPYRLQGDFTTGYTKSITYTEDVDNGRKTKNQFINDEQGYGLAQWTIKSRKEKYFDFQPISLNSIGSVYRGCDFLIHELQNDYPSVWNVLISSNSVRQASDIVLHVYENPQQQGQAVEEYRESLGISIYNEYSSSQPLPPPTPPVPPVVGPTPPIWLLIKASQNR